MVMWHIERIVETGSTNADVAQRARAGEAEGLVLVTDHQAAGRGRLDRVWTTPPGTALTFSVLLRPGVPVERWPWLPLLTGVSVVYAVRGVAGGDPSLKWPNDVLLDGRKLAGILLERVETPLGAAAVIGVGINTGMTSDQLPVDTATSLTVAGRPVEHDALLDRFLSELDKRVDAWSRHPELVREQYVHHCDTIGREVDVHLPGGGHLLGRASGIDADGRLEVTTGEGTVPVGAGDVVHVRPAV